jgi:8-oxo-dGTP pyrophosphatase MutT (NUDIX family)
MDKVISAGILLKSGKEYLLAHPTDMPWKFWEIPKGKTEEGESTRYAALREFYEETSLDLRDNTDFRIDPNFSFSYEVGKNKTVYIFCAYDINEKYKDYPFKCISITPDGKLEMDAYKWVGLLDILELVTNKKKMVFNELWVQHQQSSKLES